MNCINESIPGWMSREELAWLHYQSLLMHSVVEVGCWMGRSTYALLSGCDGLVYAVDHFKGSSSELETNHREAKTTNIFTAFMRNVYKFQNLRVKLGSSADISFEFEDNSIDMVFIDSEHTKWAVVSDLTVWSNKCRKLLCGHDIDIPDVKEALEELNIQYEKGPGSIWIVQK